MKLNIPIPVLVIVYHLEQAGFTAYIVGGAVRDVLLNRPTKDWDFTTNAKPEEVQALFPDCFYDNVFGTVGVAYKHLQEMVQLNESKLFDGISLAEDDCWNDQVMEITTYRTESAYTDRRRPDQVNWGQSLEEDLRRRDFTINAMALKVNDLNRNSISKDEIEVELIDPYDGQDDLQAKLIKAVGEPIERFNEDALRMMRAIRFGAQLGFAIDQPTLKAIETQARLLTHISWERITDELMKILASTYPAEGITLLDNSGLLEYIVPEMLSTKEVAQAGRHKLDVWHHSLESLRECPSTDPIVRLATWLHDIGKPKTQRFEGPRGVTFFGHEVVGAHMVKKIGQRLRLSRKEVDKLFTLVRWHMFTYEEQMTDAAIRRFIRRVGLENINDMMLLRVGDRKGGGSKATSWRLRELQRRIGENLYEPLSIKDLQVSGNDVMEVLQVKPGPIIGEILNNLFEEVLDDPTKNDREYQLKRIRDWQEFKS